MLQAGKKRGNKICKLSQIARVNKKLLRTKIYPCKEAFNWIMIFLNHEKRSGD